MLAVGGCAWKCGSARCRNGLHFRRSKWTRCRRQTLWCRKSRRGRVPQHDPQRVAAGGTNRVERALQIRQLAATLPVEVPVLETDAPDIPPQWLYVKAGERGLRPPSRNEPAELPRIAQTLASLRGWSLAQAAEHMAANVRQALPRLAALMAVAPR